MAELLLAAPTDFFRNSSRSYDTSAPPDRFTPIPGVGNYRGAKIKTLEQMNLLTATKTAGSRVETTRLHLHHCRHHLRLRLRRLLTCL